jgi:poly(hydroxyalkanoate) granule-associated protein
MATRKSTRKTTRVPAMKSAGKQVKASANKVWLAGLGAVAMAEEEGGKLFKGLVAKGKELEETGRERLEQARERVEELAGTAKERVETATSEVRGRAAELFGKVEDEWEERMAVTLRKFGVPSRDEISRLTRRIEELTQLVESKSTLRRPATRKSGTRRTTPRAKAS